MKQIWNFFQNQILGMQWLNELIGNGLKIAGIDISGKAGASIQFFIYDTIKILTLLYNVTVAEKLHNFRIKSIKYKFYVLKYILYINLLYI